MNTIEEDWNIMAKAYEEFNTDEDSYSYNIEWPCIKDMLPNLQEKSILDIGCGTGIFTFLLEEYSPKTLIGMDLSKEMLTIASNKAEKRQSIAKFITGDASDIQNNIDRKFDFIFSSTTTHYIKNLDTLFKGISNSLEDNGCCILSVIHPVYTSMYPIQNGDIFPQDEDWNVRYLDKSKRSYIQPWIEYNDDYENHLSISYHHLFSDYVNAIISAGLNLCEVVEPMPPESWKDNFPNRYNAFIETPTYMILKIKK
ncbi:methyltransferase domain-containing protein [Anaerosporobacter sp.]